MKFTSLLISLATVVGLGACSSSDSDNSSGSTATFTVAASFYPIEEIARRVVGDTGEVFGLTPSGDEPHGLELTAKQLDDLSSADFLFYIGEDFQPSVEKAAASLKSNVTSLDLFTSVTLLDAKEEEGEEGKDNDEHSEYDPHIWLDPSNMAKMTRAVAATLSAAMPEMAAAFESNADTYVDELDSLGNDMDSALVNCETRTVITSHDAFGYLSERAQLITIPIAGFNPEDEPSAKELEAIAAIAREQKATTIFFEVLLPEDLARTLAKTVGAKTSTLDPIEGISSAALKSGASYITIQRENLQHLVEGLRCT